MTFEAPIKDMLFDIEHLSGWSQVNSLPPYGTLDLQDVSAVLSELGRFCAEEIAPLNAPGDEVGSRFKDGKVIMPPGFETAYTQFVDMGWPPSCVSIHIFVNGSGRRIVVFTWLYRYHTSDTKRVTARMKARALARA